jgi:hypothetical protein
VPRLCENWELFYSRCLYLEFSHGLCPSETFASQGLGFGFDTRSRRTNSFMLIACIISRLFTKAVGKLSEYEDKAGHRDEAFIQTYASADYSYQEIGDYFGLHFTRIGNIVRAKRRPEDKAKG